MSLLSSVAVIDGFIQSMQALGLLDGKAGNQIDNPFGAH